MRFYKQAIFGKLMSSFSMYRTLETLCGETTNVGRGNVILEVLDTISAPYRVQDFDDEGVPYRNIIVSLRQGSIGPRIAVTAHYDRVLAGEGALDNGAAVVEILGTIEYFIRTGASCHVDFIFFDAEEEGCVGSDNYVLRLPSSYFAAVYNLDMVGNGRCLLVPNNSLNGDGGVVGLDRSLQRRVWELSSRLSLSFSSCHLYGLSDHIPFEAKRIPSTVLFTLPCEEVCPEFLRGNLESSATFRKINSGEDRFSEIEEETLLRMREFLVALVTSHVPSSRERKRRRLAFQEY